MAALRAGLIGLGMMGRHHARVLKDIEGVELVAVAGSSGDPPGVAGGLPVHGTVDELNSLVGWARVVTAGARKSGWLLLKQACTVSSKSRSQPVS